MNHRTQSYRVLVLLAVGLLLPVAGSAKTVRLDPNVSPTFQSIVLDIDANKTSYVGSVRIELEVRRATSEFLFHAEEMTLDNVDLRGRYGAIELSVDIGDEGLVRATAGRQRSSGAYTLSIDFHKDFNTRAVGLYRMEKDEQGYLFTQLEAVDARKAFPCWDEPIYKIPYQMTIQSPADQEVVTMNPTWEFGTTCGPCNRCCTKIKCPILDHRSGLCRGYDSFFWRYFNCGRFPSTRREIDFYICNKWLMKGPVQRRPSRPVSRQADKVA